MTVSDITRYLWSDHLLKSRGLFRIGIPWATLTNALLCRSVCILSYTGRVVLQLHVVNNGVPIYVQIRDQILRAIGSGTVRPGAQLPTMRQLAVDLKVDLNTVRHAYDELEQTGAIVVLRARGTYVAENPPRTDVAQQTQRVQALAEQTVSLAASAGVDPSEVAQAILQLTKRQGGRR
jgi:GntR family transcriptional regulator